MQTTALIAALGSAAGFAVSTSLQHHAAGGAPATVEGSSGRLLRHLLRRPWWLVGQTVALVSFGLHVLALQSGALAVVQPIVVSGVVFAVPLRAALSRRRPPTAELRAVAITAFGLATFLVVSHASQGPDLPDVGPMALVFIGAGLVLAALVHYTAGRVRTVPRRAALYGVTAGILFGLVAGLIKLTTNRAHETGVVGLLTGWPAWALIVVGLSGVAVNQRAYRTGALSASMPILNIVDVLVALAFGVVVFGETPAHSVGAVAAQCVALGCVAVGLRRLSTDANFGDLQSTSSAPATDVARRSVI